MDWNHLHKVSHLITWLWQHSGKSRMETLPRELLRCYVAPMIMSPLHLLCWDCEAIFMLGDTAYCKSMVLGRAVAVVPAKGGFLVQRPNGDVVMLRPNSCTNFLHEDAQLASDFIYTFEPVPGVVNLLQLRFQPDGETTAQDYDCIDLPELVGKVVAVFHEHRRTVVAVWSGRDIRIMCRDCEIGCLQFRFEPISVAWRNVHGFVGLYSWGEFETLPYTHQREVR